MIKTYCDGTKAELTGKRNYAASTYKPQFKFGRTGNRLEAHINVYRIDEKGNRVETEITREALVRLVEEGREPKKNREW